MSQHPMSPLHRQVTAEARDAVAVAVEQLGRERAQSSSIAFGAPE